MAIQLAALAVVVTRPCCQRGALTCTAWHDDDVLHGTATTLRPVTGDDVSRLAAILTHPAVARWWPGYDEERVRAELVDADGTVVFAIEVATGDAAGGTGGEAVVVGAVMFTEETSPDYRHASIDVFLDSDWHGRGLGTDAVRTVARYLVHDRGHHRLAIDPAVENARAIRTYERIGFRRVGVARRYERGGDGTWHDCLLMDLLAPELE